MKVIHLDQLEPPSVSFDSLVMVQLWKYIILLGLLQPGQCFTLGSIEDSLHDWLISAKTHKFEHLAGRSARFKVYLMTDKSNDAIARSTTQQVISRSGYNYENHNVLADDGYITQLVRIINPLADRAKLKQPPVMLMHGGTIDPTAYVWASSIQHHPEKYPRTSEDGPITSWNRSLGFTLANNGYDVWLVGTRGCNRQNQGHVKFANLDPKSSEWKVLKDLKLSKRLLPKEYWYYTMDNIIDYELPRQIEKVLSVTGADKISLLGYSMSSQITLALLASKPSYAAKVHNYISMAPLLNNKDDTKLVNAIQKIVVTLANDAGVSFANRILFSEQAQEIAALVNDLIGLRYTLVKQLTTTFFGASQKYQTLLEPAVVGNLLMQTGFVEVKQYCQQVIATRLQKFDYGQAKNIIMYGKSKPPIYNISNIHVKNWIVVSGSTDILSSLTSVKQLLDTVGPKPLERIVAPGYNHLDLVAGVENDIFVNLPILKFLDQHQLPIREDFNSANAYKRSVIQQNLDEYVPAQSPSDSSFIDGVMIRASEPRLLERSLSMAFNSTN